MNKLLPLFLVALAVTTASTLLLARPVRDDLAARHFTLPQENAIVPIDYIESTGTQYLNLLFKKGDYPSISIEVRFSYCRNRGNDTRYYNGLMGWCEGSNGYSTGLRVNHNGIALYDGRNESGNVIVEDTPPVDIEAFLSTHGAIVNGIVVPDYILSTTFSSNNYPFGLFCFSSSVTCTPKGGSSAFSVGIGRCHYLRVYSGDTLVHYFQPVRIGSTGYMLDTITGTLFANQGTGDFLLGPDIAPLDL